MGREEVGGRVGVEMRGSRGREVSEVAGAQGEQESGRARRKAGVPCMPQLRSLDVSGRLGAIHSCVHSLTLFFPGKHDVEVMCWGSHPSPTTYQLCGLGQNT